MDELKTCMYILLKQGKENGLKQISPMGDMLQPFLQHPRLSKMSRYLIPELSREIDEAMLEDEMVAFCKELFQHHHLKQRVQYFQKQDIKNHAQFQQTIGELFQPFFKWLTCDIHHSQSKKVYEEWKRECIIVLEHFLVHELF